MVDTRTLYNEKTRILYDENLRWRWIGTSGLIIALGLILMWLPLNDGLPLGPGSTGRALLFGIGPALLSAGAIGIGYELTLRRAQVRETLAIANLSTDLAKRGVVELSVFDRIDWTDFFRSNHGDIEICFSYGRSWSNTHADRVLRLASEDGRRVVVTLLDPEPQPEHEAVLDAYVHRFLLPARDALIERVEEVVAVWRDTAKRIEAETGQRAFLRIEAMRTLVPFTFYRSGDAMWLILMPRRRERAGGAIPAIRCGKTGTDDGLFDWVTDDMEACRREGVIGEL